MSAADLYELREESRISCIRRVERSTFDEPSAYHRAWRAGGVSCPRQPARLL